MTQRERERSGVSSFRNVWVSRPQGGIASPLPFFPFPLTLFHFTSSATHTHKNVGISVRNNRDPLLLPCFSYKLMGFSRFSSILQAQAKTFSYRSRDTIAPQNRTAGDENESAGHGSLAIENRECERKREKWRDGESDVLSPTTTLLNITRPVATTKKQMPLERFRFLF